MYLINILLLIYSYNIVNILILSILKVVNVYDINGRLYYVQPFSRALRFFSLPSPQTFVSERQKSELLQLGAARYGAGRFNRKLRLNPGKSRDRKSTVSGPARRV